MRITSVGEFLELLKNNKIDNDKRRFFRGHSDENYKFLPGTLRDSISSENEHRIYNDILIECPNEFRSCKSNSERLTIMQHYGVKTRLLDITANPLISLFFACHDKKNPPCSNGMVTMMDVHDSVIKTYDSDAVSILSALPKFNDQEKKLIKKKAKEVLAKPITEYEAIKEFNNIENPDNQIIGRLLHEIKKEKPAFENVIDPHDLIDNFIFSPQKQNDRIIRQAGAFIIYGLEYNVNDTFPDIHRRPKIGKSTSPVMLMFKYMQIIINRDSKNDILDELSSLGITQASVYPELYKVSDFINKKYTSGS